MLTVPNIPHEIVNACLIRNNRLNFLILCLVNMQQYIPSDTTLSTYSIKFPIINIKH